MPRALFIDSTAGKVTQIEVPFRGHEFLDALYKRIGCDLIEVATEFPNGDVLYVDEEGLLKEPKHFFDISAHQPFAGNGVIVGRETDDEGTLADCQTALTDLKITFVGPVVAAVIARQRGQ